MRRLSSLVLFAILLIGCSQKNNPVGTYIFHASSDVLVLEIKPEGNYKIQVREPSDESGAIEGRWEINESPAPTLSLHGVAWRGTQPEAGHSIWAATIENDSKICLDAEEINCFVKEK
jgi:hypothetical protein